MKHLFTLIFIGLLPLVLLAQKPSTYKYKFATPVNRVTIDEAVLLDRPNTYGKSLLILPRRTPLLLVGIYDGYYRVRYKDQLGFVHYIFLDEDYDKFVSNNYQPVDSKSVYDWENEPDDILLFAKIEYAKAIYKNPVAYKDTLSMMLEGAIFPVNHYNTKFWKATYGGETGYVRKEDILRLGKTKASVEKAGESGPETTQEYLQNLNAAIKGARTPAPEHNPPKQNKARSSAVYYIRGPRGGCYYITGSGRKEYVDRSMCN